MSAEEHALSLATPPVEQRWMLVACGTRRLAIAADRVREVVPAKPYTRLPGAPDHVPGVVNLRGRVVTVVDLSARLGLRPASAVATHRVVVLMLGGREVGVAVDDVLRIVPVADDQLVATSPEADAPFLTHASLVEAEPFQTVDIAALLLPLFG